MDGTLGEKVSNWKDEERQEAKERKRNQGKDEEALVHLFFNEGDHLLSAERTFPLDRSTSNQ